MVPVPVEVIVGILATIEGKTSPAIDGEGFSKFNCTVYRIHFNNLKGFPVISSSLVVENYIGHRLNSLRFKGLNGLKIVFFETILGADSPFLVELS
ncbi:Uncharacterised protein [Streptococcus pneumoniae]|nr:Uncharacterised protein [Streptococcus pneumoniae]COK00425.1 Uncharacterised protein [Streptococcus pneumoniae]CRF29560.1 Uncharacterised protein [Streptococcus pneumoniae]